MAAATGDAGGGIRMLEQRYREASAYMVCLAYGHAFGDIRPGDGGGVDWSARRRGTQAVVTAPDASTLMAAMRDMLARERAVTPLRHTGSTK